MICVDGHYLTHAVEQIDIPKKEEIKKFLPESTNNIHQILYKFLLLFIYFGLIDLYTS